jgi:hypothetical protein
MTKQTLTSRPRQKYPVYLRPDSTLSTESRLPLSVSCRLIHVSRKPRHDWQHHFLASGLHGMLQRVSAAGGALIASVVHCRKFFFFLWRWGKRRVFFAQVRLTNTLLCYVFLFFCFALSDFGFVLNVSEPRTASHCCDLLRITSPGKRLLRLPIPHQGVEKQKMRRRWLSSDSRPWICRANNGHWAVLQAGGHSLARRIRFFVCACVLRWLMASVFR